MKVKEQKKIMSGNGPLSKKKRVHSNCRTSQKINRVNQQSKDLHTILRILDQCEEKKPKETITLLDLCLAVFFFITFSNTPRNPTGWKTATVCFKSATSLFVVCLSAHFHKDVHMNFGFVYSVFCL